MAVLVWHTQTKTLTLIKEFAPGREEVAHGVVAGMYEKNKHDSPLQAAKYEVSVGPLLYQIGSIDRPFMLFLLALDEKPIPPNHRHVESRIYVLSCTDTRTYIPQRSGDLTEK